jgi:hypothetical protein
VDHAARVRGGKRLGHLPRDLERVVEGQRSGAGDALREVLALDPFHGEERACVLRRCAVHRVDRGDVRVAERRQQLRLALEARGPVGVADEPCGEDLDRDLTVERGVDGFPDDAHAALAGLGEEAVMEELVARFERHAREVYGTASRTRVSVPGNGLVVAFGDVYI